MLKRIIMKNSGRGHSSHRWRDRDAGHSAAHDAHVSDIPCRSAKGHACISVFLAALLVLVQPVLPSALRQGPGEQTEAYAMTGSTDYSDLFNIKNGCGRPASINGSTLRASSTYSREHYDYAFIRDGDWRSSSSFITKRPISLLHDWTVDCTVSKSAFTYTPTLAYLARNFFCGLGKDANALNGTLLVVVDEYSAWDRSKPSYSAYTCLNDMVNGADTNYRDYTYLSSCPNYASVTMAYDYSGNSLTIRFGSITKTLPSVRNTFGNQAYFCFGGNIPWENYDKDSSNPRAPRNSFIDVTFNKMEIPHLDPAIKSLNVYPYDGNTPYGRNDMIRSGSTVRVECVVKNTNYYADGERFPLHLKTISNGSYPTQGIAPFINSSYPLTVNNGLGEVKYTSLGADSIMGANGTPLTFNGTSDCKVTYYATVNRAQGQAIRLSQCLTEDSFQGTYYATTELFSEQRLIEGTHYSRGPKANMNGWNNTGPVTVKFNEGTPFDSLVIRDGSGNVIATLNAADPVWTQGDDTDGISLTYQAQSSEYSTNTTISPDTVRIDTRVPSLSFDPATLTLSASDDTGSAPAATSGIWRIVRADAQDAAPRDSRDGVVLSGNSNRRWPAETTLSNPYPGRYVAMDAAGNVCAEVEVPAYGAPGISRPEAPSPDEGDGDGDGYVGPVFGPEIPECRVTTDGFGLGHASVREDVSIDVDAENPEFGGTLTKDMATKISEHNYAFTSNVKEKDALDVKVELIDGASGRAVDSIDTARTSIAIIRTTVTDAQGNTATADLVYTFVNKGELPTVTPKAGRADAKDPFGALIVTGNGKEPSALAVRDVVIDYGRTDATGRAQLNGTVDAKVSLPGQKDPVTKENIESLISNRFEFDSTVSPGGITASPVAIYDPEGNPAEGIDLTKPGRWTAVKTLTDSNGNVTTFNLTIEKKKTDAPLPEEGAPPITPSTDIRLDPGRTNTVDDTPYFEHDPDNPVNILDAIQARPEGEDGWSAITGGSGNGDGDGSGSGNGSGSGGGTGSGDGGGSGGTPSQLPDDVKVTVTDECGRPVDPTNITDPGTYEVTVSVKDPDTDGFIVIDTLAFHIVDTSITDTDWIYKDVAKDHWGHGYIFDIGPKVINGAFNPSDVALGYMAGYAGTTDFGPGNGIIRGDAAIVVWRMAGCPEVEGDNDGQSSPKLLSLANTCYTGFADCDASPEMYWNKAISWCAANGIVEGYGDTGEFRPQNPITREEFASIIARYASFKGKDVASTSSTDLTQYPDVQDVSAWALPNMEYVVANGIMTGRGTDEGTADGTHGILDPQAHVTRAEVAKMTYMEQPSKLYP